MTTSFSRLDPRLFNDCKSKRPYEIWLVLVLTLTLYTIYNHTHVKQHTLYQYK